MGNSNKTIGEALRDFADPAVIRKLEAEAKEAELRVSQMRGNMGRWEKAKLIGDVAFKWASVVAVIISLWLALIK